MKTVWWLNSIFVIHDDHTYMKWISIWLNGFSWVMTVLDFHRIEGNNYKFLNYCSFQVMKGCKAPLSNWFVYSYWKDAIVNYMVMFQLRGNTPSSPVTLNQTWCWNTGGSCYIIPKGLQLQINLASWQKGEWSVEELWMKIVLCAHQWHQCDNLWKTEWFPL